VKNIPLFIFIFIFSTNNYGQDTIQLNEVKIDHSSLKKEKELTIKKGFDNRPYTNTVNDYYNYYYFYKIEFPIGHPLELDIYFEGSWTNSTQKKSHVESRTFEIDLYSVNGDRDVGQRLNELSWIVNLPEDKDAYHYVKQQMSLKEFNLYGNAFYLRLSTPGQQTCSSCFQYWPVAYQSEQPSEMRMKKKNFQDNNNVPVPTPIGSEIRFKMDIMTKDY
jgi:hypothetical protein